ncbi:MAG: DUF427 domain-containing protein [Solirubrobacteraceae bacterium]
MSERPILEPGPDHPITITPNHHRVRVIAGGRQIADTRLATSLREAGYPPVIYIPPSDVDGTQLTDSDHQTYCPYKGEASYFSIPGLGDAGENAVWQYRDPHPSAAPIKNLVAFYPDRVQISEEP